MVDERTVTRLNQPLPASLAALLTTLVKITRWMGQLHKIDLWLPHKRCRQTLQRHG